MSSLLKQPNVRGAGWSRVSVSSTDRWLEYSNSQVVTKTQCRYYCRPVWNGFRRTPVVRREMRALLALRAKGVAVPLVLNYEEVGEESTLVSSFIENSLGFDEALKQPGAMRTEILSSVARLIGRLHRSRWVHGALYPIHILITEWSNEPRAHLIDFEKARYLGSRRRDLERFWRYGGMLSAAERVIFTEAYTRSLAGHCGENADKA